VAGTCSSLEKAEMLKSLGCDVIINYKTDDVSAVLEREFPKGLDVVYEAVGGVLREICFNHLAVFGKLVLIGSVGEGYDKGVVGGMSWNAGDLMKKSVSVGFFFLGHAWEMNGTAEWSGLIKEFLVAVEEKKIKVILDKECESFCGLEGVTKAQHRMRKGENVGKIYTKIQ